MLVDLKNRLINDIGANLLAHLEVEKTIDKITVKEICIPIKTLL